MLIGLRLKFGKNNNSSNNNNNNNNNSNNNNNEYFAAVSLNLKLNFRTKLLFSVFFFHL